MSFDSKPSLVVLSTLFPSGAQPGVGLFVRERMFRVAAELPLFVVAPQPWFPFQGLIRWFRPGFRPPQPGYERQGEIDVYFPRFLSFPGVCKHLDGLFLALSVYPLMRRHRRRFSHIDAHFAYPEGYAATLLGRWLGVPVTMTLRGTEVRMARLPRIRARMRQAFDRASGIFSVSESLRQVAIEVGARPEQVEVVGNGVDLVRFAPEPREIARRRLGLEPDASVLVTVGGLVERKGFHRVIALLPRLRERFPTLRYLAVGGPSPEGDMTAVLKRQVTELGLEDVVHFTGPVAPDDLSGVLSAADVFVLATRNEGWANVFLEAMACGLPVVTTDVGGNKEVVCDRSLGYVVPFGAEQALHDALADALTVEWDSEAIVRYAHRNSWDSRVATLLNRFESLHSSATLERATARVN